MLSLLVIHCFKLGEWLWSAGPVLPCTLVLELALAWKPLWILSLTCWHARGIPQYRHLSPALSGCKYSDVWSAFESMQTALNFSAQHPNPTAARVTWLRSRWSAVICCDLLTLSPCTRSLMSTVDWLGWRLQASGHLLTTLLHFFYWAFSDKP